MRDFQIGPDGATENSGFRKGRVLPAGGDGWRRPSAGLAKADRLADSGAKVAATRTEAIVAVKRVAAQIGLKAGDLLLLDTLAAFSQPQDWEAGQRPLVWASNAYLMERTGYSLSTLKRHARRLAEAGVITFRDSPNGKRWGHRDAEGRIVEAYGFDLSPLAARAPEFRALEQELAEERALCQRLRRQITVARRTIRSWLEATGTRGRAAETFAALLARLPGPGAGSETLAALAETFQQLLAEIQRPSMDTERRTLREKQSEMNPTEAKSDPHIPTTTELKFSKCNRFETKHAANVAQTGQGTAQSDVGEVPESETSRTKQMRTGDGAGDVDIPMVMASCPHFAEMSRELHGYIRGWDDFHRAAERLRPMVGISEDAWQAANAALGQQTAAVSLALILDKSANGEVRSPGGYLRGLIHKAQNGQLYLSRSFHGRLSAA